MDILEDFKKKFSLTDYEANNFIKNAPSMYKVHMITKRNGGKREIAQPTKSLKIVQKWIVKKYLNNYPIHSSATAYVKGKSIIDFAKPHVSNSYLLKLDFKNFFNSIHSDDFYKFVQEDKLYNNSDVEILINLLFCRDKKIEGDFYLSIGAPSSPFVSNILMYKFDCCVYRYCKSNNVIYTRYADDLAFSTNKPNFLKSQLTEFVINCCQSLPYPNRLEINSDKTVFTSKKYNRTLTGLVLNNSGNEQVSIGRNRKRDLRAMAHQASLGLLTYEDLNKLQGMIAFLKGIDPDFAAQLERKAHVEHRLD